MKLRDAKAQVEREQPHLTGTAKMEAIKALRAQPEPAEPPAEELQPKPVESGGDKEARKPTSVGEAWGFLIFIAVGMQLIPWIVWGSLDGAPRWYDVLHAVLLVAAVAELVSAYRRRSTRNS